MEFVKESIADVNQSIKDYIINGEVFIPDRVSSSISSKSYRR